MHPDFICLFNRYIDTALSRTTVLNSLAMLMVNGFTGQVAITTGPYIGSRKIVLRGNVYDVYEQVKRTIYLKKQTVIPNDMNENMFFVECYIGLVGTQVLE